MTTTGNKSFTITASRPSHQEQASGLEPRPRYRPSTRFRQRPGQRPPAAHGWRARSGPLYAARWFVAVACSAALFVASRRLSAFVASRRLSAIFGLPSRLGGPKQEDQTESRLTAAKARARIDNVLATRALVTAFQPIYSLDTGAVVGAEALTRFVSSPVRPPDTWFAEAETIGRGLDLEFLAMATALRAAGLLPENLYISVNLSPHACLDPRLSDILLQSGLPPRRIIIEITEMAAVPEYAPLLLALAELRGSGLRIAVDDAGAGFASMRHILQLHPDLIKLDRSIVSGIDNDRSKRAFGTAMVSFAQETSAQLIAEGVETQTELTTVAELGIDSAQGYFLGTPSVSPAEWLGWTRLATTRPSPGRPKID
ncbi:EAL domain-containing protein [Arthrobacter sp. Bz4]|uniref:EAL domain-containing protein n=1 Tax=Arthrobacter sp. Bz4 TaxID=2171979 RepID=UPI000D50D37F|nr:EAL domain-containing protein [Arthrobacter sp. Bz4]PVE14978.1 diguanylate phosphodiesterase [Arthrobacter sp. Bz4]